MELYISQLICVFTPLTKYCFFFISLTNKMTYNSLTFYYFLDAPRIHVEYEQNGTLHRIVSKHSTILAKETI